MDGIVRRLRDAGAEFARIDELPFVPEDEVPDAQLIEGAAAVAPSAA
jgi:hypothetical protein